MLVIVLPAFGSGQVSGDSRTEGFTPYQFEVFHLNYQPWMEDRIVGAQAERRIRAAYRACEALEGAGQCTARIYVARQREELVEQNPLVDICSQYDLRVRDHPLRTEWAADYVLTDLDWACGLIMHDEKWALNKRFWGQMGLDTPRLDFQSDQVLSSIVAVEWFLQQSNLMRKHPTDVVVWVGSQADFMAADDWTLVRLRAMGWSPPTELPVP